jgi:hypothetical protein
MIPNLLLASNHQKSIDQAVALAAADTVDLITVIETQPVPVMAAELRANLPAITGVYSTVVGQLATTYYDEARTAANVEAAYAAYAAEYTVETEIQKAIGYAMALKTKGSTFEAVQSTLVGHVQRIINGVNRETIRQNINKDPNGLRYQRVPSAGACSFCMTLAAVAELTTEDYYTEYHSYCHCKTIPVFSGQTPYRPSYYDDFQNEYYKAVGELSQERQDAGYSDYKRREAASKFPELTITTPNILRKIRVNTGRS